MEGTSLLAPRVAKPWQGRALEGSGGSGARFWTPGFCVEGSSLLAPRVAKPGKGRTTQRALAVVARAFGPPRFCVERKRWWGRTGSGGGGARFWTPGSAWKSRFWTPRFCGEGSSLLVSRARTLECSGGSSARVCFWSRGARNRGRGVPKAQQAGAFGPPRFCVEGSSLLVWRAAKPGKGRTLEGSGSSGARFWNLGVLRGTVVTFGLEGRALLDPRGSAWKGRRFWPRGRKTVVGPYFRRLWR